MRGLFDYLIIIRSTQVETEARDHQPCLKKHLLVQKDRQISCPDDADHVCNLKL